MPFGEGDLTLHHPLELAPVGEPCQVVGARLAGELAGAVNGDRHLVRHGGHEEKVGGAEQPVDYRADAHDPDGPAANTQLRAHRVPLVARDAVDLGLGAPDRRGGSLHVWSHLATEVLDLVAFKPHRVHQFV